MTSLEPIPDSALKRLGGELAQLLDDDLWNNTEKRYLLPALEEQEVLRSKLLDAEALLTDARECRDYYKHRAEAAEAEVAKYAAILSEANTNRIGMIELNGRLHAEVARLREEALRLYNSDGSFVRLESPEAVVKNRIRAAQKSVKATDRIAELEAEVARLTHAAIVAKEYIERTEDAEVVESLRTSIAELEAGLREIHETATWALEESPAAKREGRGINPKWVADLCAALLGEGKP